MVIIVWIVLLIALLLIELITVGLTTIWFAGGALVALILAALGFNVGWQIAAFLIISFLLLFFTRPVALKYLKPAKVKTNYESAIGKQVLVKEQVDNKQGSGLVDLEGMEWTARMQQEEDVLVAGQFGEVVAVSGVKLILKPVAADTEV